MKKVISLVLAMVFVFSMAACGGEESSSATLKKQTVNGMTIAVPTDFGKFTESTENSMVAVNKTSSIAVSPITQVEDQLPTDWTEELAMSVFEQQYENVVITDFTNTAKINGADAVKVMMTGDTADGINRTTCLVVMYQPNFTTGSTDLSAINLLYTTDESDSLSKNFDDVIASIKFAE